MLIDTTTQAVDFVSKSFQLSDGSVVNCFIYDTCGQERYNAINESYYRKADAALLVYDISNRNSFDLIKNYYCPKIKDFCKKNIPIILLGNKADKIKERQIQPEEGAKLAVDYKYKFKETSCLKNENVADAFEALIELWNFEVQKNNIIKKNRTSSLENIVINKEETEETVNRTRTFCVDDQEGERISRIVLSKTKHKKKKKKCCFF